MRLLHLLSSIDPAGGGPVESVRRCGQALVRMGHDVEVLTLDAGERSAAEALELPLHVLGPSRGRYAWNARLVPWLTERGPHYDAVVVNGLWQHPGLAAHQALRPLGVPYFVFTHGMLDPWFRRTYPLKHVKKLLYWPWAEYRVLRDARAVLFTCEEERRLARQSFPLYRAHEAVVAFGTAPPPEDRERLRGAFRARFAELGEAPLLLFLGRLHPKKGCDLLIEAFAKVAPSAPELRLVMAGPDQQGWRSALAEQAAAAGIGARVIFTGMLTGDDKWGALYSADALVLPSHQENFGIVVAEALGCGVPVLISDKVNIWHEVHESRAGLVEPDTLEGTSRLLQRWLELGAERRSAMSLAAGDCFARNFTVQAMADSLVNVIEGRPGR